jgi:hypothetical protein
MVRAPKHVLGSVVMSKTKSSESHEFLNPVLKRMTLYIVCALITATIAAKKEARIVSAVMSTWTALRYRGLTV